MQKKRVIVLGATGSIGRQTLDVIRSMPDRLEVAALSAHRDIAGLRHLAAEFPSARVAASDLPEMIAETDAEIVVNGIAGSAGLLPSLAALDSGKDLALANKESIVMGYSLLQAAAARTRKNIIPVDSEHAALFQLISRVGKDEIAELVITASGGAFRDMPLERLDSVTPDQASSHPNWSMGRKITIDSASMANKGLEVIEAVRLFGFSPNRVKVLVHPQSYVHALVRTTDGSLYAQISAPDMRVPIQNALLWPLQVASGFGRLDLAGKTMEFREADPDRYPLLSLAYSAVSAGEGYTVAYNAADEIAVAAFEAGAIRFTDLAGVVGRTLDHGWPSHLTDTDSIFEVDSGARTVASRALASMRQNRPTTFIMEQR